MTPSGQYSRRWPSGYHHLYEQYVGGISGVVIPNTYAYRLIAWSDLWFKTDAAHPAVYVFVKDGTKEVSALLCRGGYDSGGGPRWIENKPAWPREPSLTDVVHKLASTQPTSQP